MPDEDSMVSRLAAYIAVARARPSNAHCRRAASHCILDLLSAAAAGLHEAGPAAVRSIAGTLMPGLASTVWFTGQSGSAVGAAWANTSAASALDLDDGHRLARGHPGAAVIPAAMAVAEEMGASWDELLTAIIIGYEVGVTIAAARQSYGNTGTWASYAVVAATTALRKTPREQIEHALAIAGESGPNQLFASAPAPRIPSPEGSAVKEGIPWAVVTGLVAVSLAEAGHTGPRNILESVRHYQFAPDLVWGEAQHILGTYFKLYACCRHIHAPLDGLEALVTDHGITADRITRIEVETTSGALRISNKVRPQNSIDIQYSIPYCLGLMLLQGPSVFLPLGEDALSLPGATALAEKVDLKLNEQFDARFPAETLARVTVVCGNERFTSAVTAPKGEASTPLSWKQIQQKFRAATRLIASTDQQEAVIDAVDCACVGDIVALTTCLGQTTFV
jgi:2-methylcitrate dehydratase PrpD